ncbi:MAG: amino acid adenylation domain-containing protein [Ignavibacteria bacterium]|nr:amino acid adenylation domain-containing protein [Ignavibacteria bacterium]
MSKDSVEPNKSVTRRDSIDGLYRLSGLQHGMLFHGLYDPGTGAYINQFECDIYKLDFEIFRKSWDYVLRSHTILRTVFYHDKLSMPVQCVFKDVKTPMEVLDYRSLSEEDQNKAIKEYKEADRIRGFDFNTAPMMRLVLIRLDDERYRMIWTYHHIIFDGWSIPIMIAEFLNAYEDLLAGKELAEKEVDRFEDFIRYVERIDKEKVQKYWKDYLKNAETGSLLPFIGKTAERTKGVGAYKSNYLEINSDITNQLQNYAKRNRITPNTVMQGVWSYCLHMYTGSKDVIFGVIVSGRPEDLPGVEQRVGLFINPLPLHSELIEDQKVTKWLQELQDDQFSSRKYQNTPLADIQAWTGIQGDIFDCLLTFENYPVSKLLASAKWSLKVENVQTSDKNNYPLTIIISLTDQISIRFSYNTALLKEEYVKGIISRFENVLLQFIENDESRLKDIEILTKSEKQKLLTEFNVSNVKYPQDKSIVDLFEEQVMKTPDADAVVFEGKTLTYRQLNERSNNLAHYLRSKGVKEDTMVPLYIERGLDMMTGLMGILKAGAAYVPVDTDLPSERISFILQDTSAKIIVSSKQSSSILRSITDIETIEPDSSDSPVELQSSDNLKTSLTPNNLAYVVYTSGSTGNPKGVMIEHKNLVDYANGLESKTQINNCRSFALVSTIATDLGNTVIYSSLLSGGALHIFSKDTTSDVEKLHNYFDEHSIECVKIVPSHWKALHLDGKNLIPKKLLIFGGEALHSELVESIRSENPECTVVNHYGPTETTIGKLLHVTEAGRKYDNTIPIGKPFSNTTVYVLSKDLRLCPAGIPGQLFIAGEGLARGYLNNEDLTNQKFIRNPFINTEASRMYATGDLVKYLPDGNIEFIGRADDQVKIRGYRIETGEIENALLKCELVKQAVVLANEDNQGNKRLVGYVIPEGKFDRDEILSRLKEKVPEYMLPSVLVEMESFPLAPNGKIDRKSLPDPDVTETLSSEYAAPRSEAEKQLTELWKELLDVEEIGIHDNFFELGGDSIISIQLVSRARRLGYEFLIGDIFTYQTIARLSALLDQRSDTSSNAPDEEYVVTGPSGLLPIQQWYFEKDPEDVSHFNQYVLLDIDKGITDAILKRAVEQLMAHHDALRFKYFKKDGVWNQVYESDTELSGVIIEDLRTAEKDTVGNLISEKAIHYQTSLDIEKGEIFKVVLIQTPSSEVKNRLLIVIHHLAIDGVSWRILLEDLEMLISGFKGGGKTDLGKKTGSYRQWYETLENYGKSRRLNSQLEYWEKIISSMNSLPADKKYDGVITAKDITHHKMSLDSETTRRLIQDVPKAYHTEINDILLSALAKTLSEWSGSDKVTIGMEGHGRENIEEGIDTTRTIGWFTTHYPVMLEINALSEEGSIIKSVKEQLRQVPDKGLGFGVLKYINKISFLKSAPQPDIIFNYLGQSDNVLNASQWFALAGETGGSERSEKFVVDNKISLSGIVQSGELMFDWRYSQKNYDLETIERIADQFQTNLKSLISHSLERLRTGIEHTPSDYGVQAFINYGELDKFLNETYNGKPRRDSLESLYKLSGLQTGMLFHGLYEGGAGSYVRQFSCELTGADLNILKESWQTVIMRHSILRSAFYHDSFSIPVQCVYREAAIPVEVIDLRSSSDAEQAMSLMQYKESEHDRGFDFKAAPLMRLGLIRISEERYFMLWTWHHILFDGWSLPILMEEFLSVYKSLSDGKQPEVKDTDNFEDFIRYTERIDKDQEKSYWINYMKGIEQSTLLPFIGSKTERTKAQVNISQSL